MRIARFFTHKADAEPDESSIAFDKELEGFCQQAVSGGYSLAGPTPGSMKTIIDIANIKLLHANYTSSQKLRMAIEKFDRSSTTLGKRMLYLTIVMAGLTLVMAILSVAQSR